MKKLDRLEYAERIDRHGMLRMIDTMPEQLTESLSDAEKFFSQKNLSRKFSSVVIAGMGGSAIGGDIIRNWIGDEASVPIEVLRNIQLPAYASEETLVVVISYSGETEESLRVLVEASRRGCVTYSVASGGRLMEISGKLGTLFMRVKPNLPPRAALPQLFASASYVLWKHGIAKNLESELNAVAERLQQIRETIGFPVPVKSNPAKSMAVSLLGKIPVIYSLERMGSVARRLKDQFNENSKVSAKFDLIPEALHNEVEGWTNLGALKAASVFSAILVRDNGETPVESPRVEHLKVFLKSVRGLKVHEVKGDASTRLGRIFSAIYFGDYLSYYLALARGVDPTPVEKIQSLKKKVLAEIGFEEWLEAGLREAGSSSP